MVGRRRRGVGGRWEEWGARQAERGRTERNEKPQTCSVRTNDNTESPGNFVNSRSQGLDTVNPTDPPLDAGDRALIKAGLEKCRRTFLYRY